MSIIEQLKNDPVYQKLIAINDSNPWMKFANRHLGEDQNTYVVLAMFYLQNEVENRKDYEAVKALSPKMGPAMHIHMGIGALAKDFTQMGKDLNLSPEEIETLLDGLVDAFKVNVKAIYDTMT